VNKGLLLAGGIILILAIAGGAVLFLQEDSGDSKNPVTNQNTQTETSTQPANPEDEIKKVAEEYWQAVRYSDYAAAYDLLQPADRQLISKEEYVKKQNADPSLSTINEIKIDSVKTEGNKATVRITLITNTGDYPGTNEFVLIDGKWYRVMSEENKESLGIK